MLRNKEVRLNNQPCRLFPLITKEFKIEAVKLAEESGKSCAQVARDLDISDVLLHKWRSLYSQNQEQAFKNQTSLSPEEQEIKRLKLELKEAKEVIALAISCNL